MTDGIVPSKTSYTKGEVITVTVTDSGRAAVPAGPDTHEDVVLSGPLSTGQIASAHIDVVTPGTPAVPQKDPGSLSATGGRTVTLVAGSATSTTAQYTTTA